MAASNRTELLSIYSSINKEALNEKATIPFDLFLEGIRDGRWEDIAHAVRKIEDKKKRDAKKQQIAPCVTVAGQFKERNDAGLTHHSGYIPIDADDLKDPEGLKTKLVGDKYVVSAFISISGRGLCIIFRINPDKHREAFQGIGEYMYEKYGVIIDPTSINVSRTRFVSYDPSIYIAEGNVQRFTQYPKAPPPKKIDKTIFTSNDFQSILEQIVKRRLNLCENYHEWLRIGFAFVHQFNESGREFFHVVSQYSSKYDSNICDKQYNSCLRAKGTNTTTISTFYYYAKNAGCEIYSARTRTIAYTAQNAKENGLNAAQVEQNLEKYEGIKGDDVGGIIQQVIENKIHLNEDTLLDQLEIFLRQNYDLKRNGVTRYIEDGGKVLEQKDMNSMFIRAKKIYEKLSYDIFDRLVNSNFIPTYNPFQEYFDSHKDDDFGTGHIEKLLSSIVTTDTDFVQYFGMKWFVGIISSMHGQHSPLFLVLSGEKQNTGKTQWFRRLLPKYFHEHGRAYPDYYAESKLDAGKDDEILMTQKLLIVDDEMGGKSKKEAKHLKEILSKQTFSLREPYGRNNVDLNRIAVLGGTTNEDDIIYDIVNRRTLAVKVYRILFEVYNSVDKDAWMLEAYKLWKEGFEWELNDADILRLKTGSEKFNATTAERELIMKYWQPGNKYRMTVTDIKVFLEAKTNQKLTLQALGAQMKALGFTQEHEKTNHNTSTRRVYLLDDAKHVEEPEDDPDDLPF